MIINESRRPYVDLKNFQSILHLVVHTYRIIYCLQLYKCAIINYVLLLMTSSMNKLYPIVSASMKGSVPRVSPTVVVIIVSVSAANVAAETVAFC